MKLGLQEGLGPGHIVLDGDPAPRPQKGHSPPIFGPYLLRPNGCMNQDVTWYGARPRPRRLCVRWGPPPQKGGGGVSCPIFGPFLLWPNGCMHQDATWYADRSQITGLCVRWEPTLFPKRRRSPEAERPNFRPMFIVTGRLDGSRCHLARR